MDELIRLAIDNMQLLEFYYDGGIRKVEPYCYGKTTKGNVAVRAYQIDGYSSSNKMGWKLFDLSKASSFRLSNDFFFSIRPDYKRGDRSMLKIFLEL